MDTVYSILKAKPRVFIYATGGYFIAVSLMKWLVHPSVDAAWFILGGAIGLYFLDAAEMFFALNPSPFRSIVFLGLFAVVAFFVVTSSTGTIGSGLVLSLYLQMVLWQIGELHLAGNLNSWYRMVESEVMVNTQRFIFAVTILVFLLESFIFIR